MDPTSRARRNAGFTMIEIIVTLGLLAVIAAFAIPTVMHKRGGGGDVAKVHDDLTAVETALETFATDSKSGVPHQVSALMNRPVADVTQLIDGTAMNATQVSAWRGPYLNPTTGPAGGDSLATGHGAYVMNFIDRYDAVANVPEHTATGAVNGTFSATNTLFASLEVHGLTTAQAESLNSRIDGASEASAIGANTTGQFRFSAPVGGMVVAYYLAVPIAK